MEDPIWVVYSEGEKVGETELLCHSADEDICSVVIDSYCRAYLDRVGISDEVFKKFNDSDTTEDHSPNALTDLPAGHYLWEHVFDIPCDDLLYHPKRNTIGYEIVLLEKVGTPAYYQIKRLKSWSAAKLLPSVEDFLRTKTMADVTVDSNQEKVLAAPSDFKFEPKKTVGYDKQEI